uniref:Uncharacterized protein n=1 Tax=Anguilla anguilla TaxID=7936 RepID=A0A0E9P930_ANGAN
MVLIRITEVFIVGAKDRGGCVYAILNV